MGRSDPESQFVAGDGGDDDDDGVIGAADVNVVAEIRIVPVKLLVDLDC